MIPTRNINWFLLIALLFFGVLGGLVYLAVWIGKAATICPLCEGDVYGRAEVVIGGETFVFEYGYCDPNDPNLAEAFDTEAKLRIARARHRRRPVASSGVESG